MAYDERLAQRVRSAPECRSGVAERKMFGGLAFMIGGNMCCCVTDRGLMVRVGTDAYAEALAQPHTGEMDMSGRPMRGWAPVAPEGVASDAGLTEWVRRGAEFAATLPPK